MGNINVSVFSGNLGKDAVIRPFNNGKGAVSFSVAYTESWLDANKQKQEVTHWLECERVGSEAFLAYAKKFFLKGQNVLVKGKAINKEWVSDGVNHRKTIFSLEDIQLLGEIKGLTNNQGAQAPQQQAPQQQPQQQSPQQRPYGAAAAPSPAVPSFSYHDEDDVGF